MSGSGTRTEFDFPEFETQLTRDDEDLMIERKPSAELDASDEYAELERQLTELRDQLTRRSRTSIQRLSMQSCAT